MASATDPLVLESITIPNIKINSELHSQNAVSHQNRLQILAEKALAKSLESMDTMQISEAIGPASLVRSETQNILAALAGTVAAIQQMMKGAQTTPPAT